MELQGARDEVVVEQVQAGRHQGQGHVTLGSEEEGATQDGVLRVSC